jgi:hypothetical protein
MKGPSRGSAYGCETRTSSYSSFAGSLEIKSAPVATKPAPWSLKQKLAALQRGPHQSARKHVEFLCGEFIDMIHKGQWILLPAHMLLYNKNLRLCPLVIVPQRG